MAQTATGGTPLRSLSRGTVAWSFVETGRTTYIVLISVYVFVPYLAAVLASDPVKGQGLIASISTWAGLAGALIAPLFGTTIDHLGRRKALLVLLSLLTVPLCGLLWFAAPGQLGIVEIAIVLGATGLLFSLCEIAQNSLLTVSVKPGEQAHASGLAYAFGNGASMVVMIFVLWAFVLPGMTHAPFLPAHPLFGLDPAKHEPERLAGPLSGLIILVTLLPLILYTRDVPPPTTSIGTALRRGAADLRGLLGLMREAPQARTFLIARMIFADAQGGIILFTGVFAAGVFGWGPMELMVEGLLSSIFAAAGGLLAGWLDNRIGAKRSLIVTLSLCLVCAIAEIGVAKDHMFFVIPYDPAINGRPWSLPIFATWPEWIFIACDFAMSTFIVSAFASSRTLMAHLAPPGRAAAFFGLFALSGRATAWACPMLVGMATVAFGSQQMGYIPIAVMLVIGLAILIRVRSPGQGHLDIDPVAAAVESPSRAALSQG